MAAGRLYETSINVTVTDTSGLSDTKELVVNIEGTNTAPVITSGEHGVIIANPAPLVEDGGVSKVTGQVTAREYDEGDHVVAFKFVNDKGELVDSLTGKYGTISIDKDGNYTYTFNNGQAQHLGAGEMAAEHFNVVAVDTYGAQTTTPSDLQIQIQGTNDAPVITSPTPVLNLTELASGQAEITGTITFNDADKKADGTFYDTHTFSVRPSGAAEAENGAAAEGKYGTLTIDEHGNYKYTLTSDALGEGDKYTETFTATVDDGNGGKATQTITVNLTGTNDAPVITDSHTDNGTTGSFIFTDADVKADGSFYDTHSFAISVDGKAHGVTLDSTGTHGTVTIDGLGTFELTQGDGGNWHYAFTASPEAIAGAALGSLVTHDFQIIVNDGHATAMTPAGEDSLSVSFMGTGTPPADMDLGNLTPGMAQGDHIPDAGWQVISLFNDGTPGGPHGGPACCVQGQGIVKGPHVLPVEGRVAFRLHVVGPNGPLGVDIEHEEAVKPVVQGHPLHRFQGVVQIVRGGGRGIDAHADEGVLPPGAQNITILPVVVGYIYPSCNVVIGAGLQGLSQGGIEGDHRQGLGGTGGDVHGKNSFD